MIIFYGVLFLLLAGVLYLYYRQWSTIKFYEKQGVTVIPGAYRPILGNLLEFVKYDATVRQSEESMNHAWLQIYGNMFDKDSVY